MASVNLVIKQDLDITCMQNDTFKLDMNWVDGDNNPINLTGYNFKSEVRKNSSNAILLTFENSDFTKDANGNLLMNKSAANMNIKPGVYVYDLQSTQISTTDVSTWLGGLFVIEGDVTG
tara:strand:- start:82 stop:438 length:357 start_codon:yes stop_codon:yes gene_type:complete